MGPERRLSGKLLNALGNTPAKRVIHVAEAFVVALGAGAACSSAVTDAHPATQTSPIAHTRVLDCVPQPSKALRCPGGIIVTEGVLTQGPKQTFDVEFPGGSTQSFGADNPTAKVPLSVPVGGNRILFMWNGRGQGPHPEAAIRIQS
jgi:hypothetical protein